MTLVRRVTRPIQKVEMPKLYTGLYMYKKINQYYIVQAAIADTIKYASPEDDGLETLTV